MEKHLILHPKPVGYLTKKKVNRVVKAISLIVGDRYKIREWNEGGNHGDVFEGVFKGMGNPDWYDKTPFLFKVKGMREYQCFYYTDIIEHLGK